MEHKACFYLPVIAIGLQWNISLQHYEVSKVEVSLFWQLKLNNYLPLVLEFLENSSSLYLTYILENYTENSTMDLTPLIQPQER